MKRACITRTIVWQNGWICIDSYISLYLCLFYFKFCLPVMKTSLKRQWLMPKTIAGIQLIIAKEVGAFTQMIPGKFVTYLFAQVGIFAWHDGKVWKLRPETLGYRKHVLNVCITLSGLLHSEFRMVIYVKFFYFPNHELCSWHNQGRLLSHSSRKVIL